MIEAKYVNCTKHPEKELYIYNYTNSAQYDQVWNEVTLQCRGLILDPEYNYISRPFAKFFNFEERADQVLPDESYEVYEKLDGSLGITYWVDDMPYISTRGSFTSHQAEEATIMLHGKYSHAISRLNRDYTYLFEIIYPQNRIVVDYGSEYQLVLLAIIDTKTGFDLPLKDIGFPIVQEVKDVVHIDELRHKQIENKEGYVVKYKSGLRIKVKFEEYVRLHKIITQISSISIWEIISSGKSIQDIIDVVPDELFQWVTEVHDSLQDRYQNIETVALSEFRELGSRKETAQYIMTCSYPKILFSMLDKKPYNDIIWSMIKPKYESPFNN